MKKLRLVISFILSIIASIVILSILFPSRSGYDFSIFIFILIPTLPLCFISIWTIIDWILAKVYKQKVNVVYRVMIIVIPILISLIFYLFLLFETHQDTKEYEIRDSTYAAFENKYKFDPDYDHTIRGFLINHPYPEGWDIMFAKFKEWKIKNPEDTYVDYEAKSYKIYEKQIEKLKEDDNYKKYISKTKEEGKYHSVATTEIALIFPLEDWEKENDKYNEWIKKNQDKDWFIYKFTILKTL